MRFLLAGMLSMLILVPAVRAGEAEPTGNWKVSIIEEGKTLNLWILQFEKEGKLTGKVFALKGVPPTKVDSVEVKDDLLIFNLQLNNGVSFSFEGKLPGAGGKKIHGSLSRGSQLIATVLEATTAKNQYQLDREMVARYASDPRVFGAALELIKNGKAEKANPTDIQEWVEIALRSSEKYGPRFQAETSVRLLDAMANDYPEQAVAVGRKIEANLDPKTPALVQLQLLNSLLGALKKSAQEDQARKLEARVDKLENLAYAEHAKKAIDFPVDKFAGRKGKSKRAILMELFTGGQCPPCVAADIAFDAVEKSYPSTDVVLLQYHLHIPGPDPLTNPDAESRQEYYGSVVRGTPALLFNGKAKAPGGGGRDEAKEKFAEYQGVIDPMLEKEGSIKLTATAVRKGNKIDIRATADDVENPGDKVRLRLALVEDWVRYKSPNGLAYHHRVVRAMPGGAKGMPLAKKEVEVSASVNLSELQENLNKYLDDFARKEEPFPDAQRPMRLRSLHVVAFVQNDSTAEVLHAIDVPVTNE